MRLICASTLVLLAGAAAPLGAATSGSLPAGSAYLAPGQASPEHHSKRFVVDAAELATGVALPLVDPRGALVVVVPERGTTKELATDLRLETADGQRLLPGGHRSGVAAPRRFSEPELERFDLPGAGTVLELDVPAGDYKLRGRGRATVLVAEPNAAFGLTVRSLPLAARAGEPVKIEAHLDGDGAIAEARVVARFADGGGAQELLLAETAPGVYSASFTPAVHGFAAIDVRVDAAGILTDGRRFRRTGITGVMATAAAADLDLDAVELDGKVLRVPVAGAAGAYRLEATFGGSDGAGAVVGLAFAREELLLGTAGGAPGQALVELPVPAAAAGADRVTLRLLNHDSLGLEREAELAIAVPGEARGAELKREALPASKRLGRRLADERGGH